MQLLVNKSTVNEIQDECNSRWMKWMQPPKRKTFWVFVSDVKESGQTGTTQRAISHHRWLRKKQQQLQQLLPNNKQTLNKFLTTIFKLTTRTRKFVARHYQPFPELGRLGPFLPKFSFWERKKYLIWIRFWKMSGETEPVAASNNESRRERER